MFELHRLANDIYAVMYEGQAIATFAEKHGLPVVSIVAGGAAGTSITIGPNTPVSPKVSFNYYNHDGMIFPSMCPPPLASVLIAEADQHSRLRFYRRVHPNTSLLELRYAGYPRRVDDKIMVSSTHTSTLLPLYYALGPVDVVVHSTKKLREQHGVLWMSDEYKRLAPDDLEAALL